MDCFVSVEQFPDFEFFLQQMFHIQDHSVQKGLSDGVYFSRITSLHCAECNSTKYRLYRVYFLEHVLEISCINKNILRKKSIVYQRVKKVGNFTKKRAQVRPCWRSTEDSDVFTGKPPWYKLLTVKL